MSIEQYIVRELKQDIKYLIKKVAELEQKLEDAHPTKKPYEDPYFKRAEGYREWNKTHDNYKVLYAPDGIDEHGKIIKYDKEKK